MTTGKYKPKLNSGVTEIRRPIEAAEVREEGDSGTGADRIDADREFRTGS